MSLKVKWTNGADFSGTQISVPVRQQQRLSDSHANVFLCVHLCVCRMASPAVLTLPMLDDKPGRTRSAQVPIQCGCCLVPNCPYLLWERARPLLHEVVWAHSMRVLNGAEKGMLVARCSPSSSSTCGRLTKSVKVINEIHVGLLCVKLRFRTRFAHGRALSPSGRAHTIPTVHLAIQTRGSALWAAAEWPALHLYNMCNTLCYTWVACVMHCTGITHV